jgi:predicted nucleic-acid-binding protein
MESGKALVVSKAIMLELEWVVRGYYKFEREEVASVLRALMALPHITIEDVATVEQAFDSFEQGLDFADTLHHASYKVCEAMTSLDDKNFSKK